MLGYIINYHYTRWEFKEYIKLFYFINRNYIIVANHEPDIGQFNAKAVACRAKDLWRAETLNNN